jgi:hypothetical protein
MSQRTMATRSVGKTINYDVGGTGGGLSPFAIDWAKFLVPNCGHTPPFASPSAQEACYIQPSGLAFGNLHTGGARS